METKSSIMDWEKAFRFAGRFRRISATPAPSLRVSWMSWEFAILGCRIGWNKFSFESENRRKSTGS